MATHFTMVLIHWRGFSFVLSSVSFSTSDLDPGWSVGFFNIIRFVISVGRLAQYALSAFLNEWQLGSKSPLLGQRRRLVFVGLASIRLMYPWLLYNNLHWTVPVPSRRQRHGKDQHIYHRHRDSLGIPSSASHGFRPFVPSVTTILQVDTFNSQHVSQYTPHLNYCLMWDNSLHMSQYTPRVEYCLRRSMSRGKQMMCRFHSGH
jgi:hypothetical protein